MKKFIVGLGLLFASTLASAQGLNGTYVRLTPTTLPTICRLGDVRVNSISGSLSLCNGSSWDALASGSNVPALTTLGDTLYEDATPKAVRLPGNTTTTKKFLNQTGNGTISAAPAWSALAGADLPNPSASTLGGVQSYAAVSNQWINTISTSGVPSSTQPAFSNISGTVAAAQLPNPSASTLGGIQSTVGASNQWISSISTSGVPGLTQPAFSNISGTASLTTQVTGILPVANGGLGISSGTSGGIPAYTATGTIASSALLTNHALVIGGGAGVAPAPLASLGTATTVLHGAAAANPSYSAVVLTTDVSGTLPIANGGTNNASLGVTAGGVVYTDGSKLVNVGAGTSGFVLTSAGSSPPTWSAAGGAGASFAPSLQSFLSSSGTYGLSYYFTVTSANATAGATYTNNGNTFTVTTTISAGTSLLVSSTGAPTSSGTLTKATGTGDATITFSAFKAPLYIRMRMVGGGGGGGEAGNAVGSGGSDGSDSTFGSSTAGGGKVGFINNGTGGVGGTATCATGTGIFCFGLAGGNGNSEGTITSGSAGGGMGGSSVFGGAGGGSGGTGGGVPLNGQPNTGGGGGGANGATFGGSGGGSGGYVEATINNPAATYSYGVGAKGTGRIGNGGTGADGGSGIIIVQEFFQ